MSYQAVTAEYCDIGKNIDKSVCLDTKISREERQFRAFACSTEMASGQQLGGLWCQQQALREKLKTLQGDSKKEERIQVAKELKELTPSNDKDSRKRLAENRAAAVKSFCEQTSKSSFHICKTASVSGDSYSYDS